jgi:predicted nucleic acid-binding protein
VVVVDSSVWVAYFRNAATDPVRRLQALELELGPLVGDAILLEVLQGATDTAHALRIERLLRRFHVGSMLDANIAKEAAANYRLLRSRGTTVRKMADLIIGTWCIEHRHALLHDDRDFEPIRVHLGLTVA